MSVNPNRNTDGTFASSGGDQTGGSSDSSNKPTGVYKSLRNSSMKSLTDETQDKLEKLKSDLEKSDNDNQKKMIQRYIDRTNIKLEKIQKIESTLNSIDNLFDISRGKDIHVIGAGGYKNGQRQSGLDINKNNFNVGVSYKNKQGLSHKIERIMTKKDKRGIVKSEIDKIMNGKTIISDSGLLNHKDPSVSNQAKTILNIWNNIFSDSDRESIDVLSLRTNTQNFNSSDTVFGTWIGRKYFPISARKDVEDPFLESFSMLSIMIDKDDSGVGSVSHVMIHEMAHKKYSTMKESNPDKITKFTDDVFNLGKDGATTEYAKSIWNSYDKETNPDRKLKIRNLIANEYHSEFISGITYPQVNNPFWELKLDKVKKANELIQELYKQ